MRRMTSRQAGRSCRWVDSNSRDGWGRHQIRAKQVGVCMKSNVDSKHRVTLPPASSTTSDGHGAPGRSSQVPACAESLVTLTGAKTRRAGGMGSRSYSAPAPATEGATFDAVDASANEMKIDGKGKKNPINMDSRSQPSKSVVAPLVLAPPARQAQLHVAPARSTAQHSLPACPCKHRSLRSSPPVCPVPSLPVPERETVGYDVIGCAGQRQAAIVSNFGGR